MIGNVGSQVVLPGFVVEFFLAAGIKSEARPFATTIDFATVIRKRRDARWQRKQPLHHRTTPSKIGDQIVGAGTLSSLIRATLATIPKV
jgi:hypothetical protein